MKSKRLTFCAVMAAVSAVIMLVAWFPYLTYAVPLTASLTILAVLIEYDKKSAIITYFASCVPVFLFCEIEAKFIYICFAGFYPVLKAVFEKIPFRPLEYVLKFLCFNVAVIAVYFVCKSVIGVGYDDMGQLGKYGVWILIVGANAVFFAYDILLSRMAIFYIYRLQPAVDKILKRK